MNYLDTEKLAATLADLRYSRRLSLRQVTQITGISPSTLNRVENQKGVCDFDTVAAIAKWANVSVDYFVLPSTRWTKPEWI